MSDDRNGQPDEVTRWIAGQLARAERMKARLTLMDREISARTAWLDARTAESDSIDELMERVRGGEQSYSSGQAFQDDRWWLLPIPIPGGRGRG